MNCQKHNSAPNKMFKNVIKKRNSLEFEELPPKDPMIQCHAQNWACVKTLE